MLFVQGLPAFTFVLAVLLTVVASFTEAPTSWLDVRQAMFWSIAPTVAIVAAFRSSRRRSRR